jgi:hypothetical protein
MRRAAGEEMPIAASQRRDKRLSLCLRSDEREHLRRLTAHLGVSQTSVVLRAIRELSDREGVSYDSPVVKPRSDRSPFQLDLCRADMLAMCRVASRLGTWSCSEALRRLIRDADAQCERGQP